ncbi:MAG: thiamine biosynthesis protein [Desulfobulbaceae bacterium]|nr:thiamine biosynthesis protein [Desulfobulbaceae bacterium]
MSLGRRRALALFSGGLDSILACRVLMEQGVEVVALRFITPFFDGDVAGAADYSATMQAKYGIHVQVLDVSRDYINMLRAPQHGFGRHFNPCIDCKIFMLRQARALMPEFQASFLATGEVLGQRPMSQRRDTLHLIERESGCAGILLRPLSARLLPPTKPELTGLVDRERLYRLAGRGRKEQQALAEHFNIVDYPAPAGGCLLADVNLALRFRRLSPGIFGVVRDNGGDSLVDDFRLLLLGRHFEPLPGLWFILGRDQKDNERLLALREPGDWLLHMVDRPGPVALLRRGERVMPNLLAENGLDMAGLEARLAGLVLRYGKKVAGQPASGLVRIERGGPSRVSREEVFAPLADELVQDLVV